MGWPQVTFIALYVFMSTTFTAITFHRQGNSVGIARIFVEAVIATVTFGLLIQGGFFN